MRRCAAATVSLVVLSQAVHFLTFSGLALLLPLIREDLGITFAQAGVLSVAMTASYALAQIPAGYASDRYGARRLFFAGLVGWCAFALALSVAFSYWTAVIILFAAGACRALVFAPGLALVSSWFPPDRRATAMSLFVIGSFIGTIGVSLTAPVLTSYFGWRPAFALYALLGIAVGAAFWFFAAEKPRKGGVKRVDLRDALHMTIYFGPLFFVPVEALGQRTAGLATGVGNLFANLGALASAYALGLVKDATGAFASGFYGIAVLCAAGVLLSIVLARLRNSALILGRQPPPYPHVELPALARAARKA